jgi:hypothetical protein
VLSFNEKKHNDELQRFLTPLWMPACAGMTLKASNPKTGCHPRAGGDPGGFYKIDLHHCFI